MSRPVYVCRGGKVRYMCVEGHLFVRVGVFARSKCGGSVNIGVRGCG